MSNIIKQRRILKDNLQATKLMNLGLFEQASKIQLPTTQTITKTADDTKKELQTIKETIENVKSQTNESIKPLDFQSTETAYSLIKTNVKVKTIAGDLPAWQFNSRSQNLGRIIVFEKDNKEYIWNVPKMANAFTLTEGLKEILFNNATDENIITLDDIEKWTQLITTSGLGHTYKRSDLFKNKIQIIKNRLETMQPQKEGEGINTVLIPSDPDKLRSELVLQLAAVSAGNNNLFNKTNAILQEMLSQKLIKASGYRNILKTYFHI
jgi:hypothetical protein